MAKSSATRIMRRSVKKGVYQELKRRTGRSLSNAEVDKMIEAKIAEKEAREIMNNPSGVVYGRR